MCVNPLTPTFSPRRGEGARSGLQLLRLRLTRRAEQDERHGREEPDAEELVATRSEERRDARLHVQGLLDEGVDGVVHLEQRDDDAGERAAGDEARREEAPSAEVALLGRLAP